MTRLAALYRALNVGRRRITMDRLRGVHEREGHRNVRTLLASGNVVFTTRDDDRATLASRLERGLEREVGFASEAVLRDAAELRASIERNPFLDGGAHAKLVHTLFLRDHPEPKAVAALLENHRGPEQVEVSGREVFVHYVEGVARSKLDLSKLGVGTSRNANTVAKLLELLDLGEEA